MSLQSLLHSGKTWYVSFCKIWRSTKVYSLALAGPVGIVCNANHSETDQDSSETAAVFNTTNTGDVAQLLVHNLDSPGVIAFIFLKNKLNLRPVTYLSGVHGSGYDVPHGYMWSPHLVPKPKDWGPKIDVVGFCFLNLASNYQPPESLVAWLKAGTKPIYIGFGSLPVQEPEKMTKIMVEALERTGQRGIINKGWGGLGNSAEPKEFVYLLDNCPHDWLFLHCMAVVHHGGAGTTAAGLRAASAVFLKFSYDDLQCPTTIIPFFGDQPFWGEQVHARGLGPPPIPVDQFSLQKLVDAIKFMMEPQVKKQAVEMAKAIKNEDGVTGAVQAFFKHLPDGVVPPQSSGPSIDTYNPAKLFFSLIKKSVYYCG
ncbi:hypothetical protein ACLOJK_037540 [Asimina triloba]